MDVQTAEEGTSVLIKGNGFEKAGHTFKGWSTTENGSVISDDDWQNYINNVYQWLIAKKGELGLSECSHI